MDVICPTGPPMFSIRTTQWWMVNQWLLAFCFAYLALGAVTIQSNRVVCGNHLNIPVRGGWYRVLVSVEDGGETALMPF
jgi:hypothetical protein